MKGSLTMSSRAEIDSAEVILSTSEPNRGPSKSLNETMFGELISIRALIAGPIKAPSIADANPMRSESKNPRST